MNHLTAARVPEARRARLRVPPASGAAPSSARSLPRAARSWATTGRCTRSRSARSPIPSRCWPTRSPWTSRGCSRWPRAGQPEHLPGGGAGLHRRRRVREEGENVLSWLPAEGLYELREQLAERGRRFGFATEPEELWSPPAPSRACAWWPRRRSRRATWRWWSRRASSG